MDADAPASPPPALGLEDTLAAVEAHLADAERQAAALLNAARRLRRAAHEGAVASLPAAVAAAQADAARAGERFAEAAAALEPAKVPRAQHVECRRRVRAHTDERRATEVAVAVHALHRMLDLGRPGYVRVAWPQAGLGSARLLPSALN